MKVNVYSYRDKLLGYGALLCDFNDQTAIRGFAMQINSKGTMNNFRPGDFDLYRIGTFDSEKGTMTNEKFPVLVCSGTDVLNGEKEDG